MGNLSWILFLTNTIFTFTCMALCVEMLFSIFRIKNYRLRSLLRAIPFLNLMFLNVLDLGLFLNPLQCNSCMQNLIFALNEGLKETLEEQSLLRYLASFIPNFPFTLLLYGFILISLSIFGYKLLRLLGSIIWLKSLIRRSKLLQFPNIGNPKLRENLLKYHIKMYLSSEISSPMAAFDKIILLPESLLKEISQEEFETIIAHETEHLYWKDSRLKCLIEMTAAVFWWVPTKWWFNRLGLEQEMACDSAIKKYHMATDAMASSLLKSIKIQQNHCIEHAMLCKLSSKSYCFKQRMRVLLNNKVFPKLATLDLALISLIILISMACMFN